MAVESTLLRLGYLVAEGNYGNNQGLPGPSGSGQFLAVAVSHVTDNAVVLAGSGSGAVGEQILGILQNKPALGAAADVGFIGVTKAVVGTGGSTRGFAQMADATGAVTDWDSGADYAQIGIALENGVEGQIISMFVNAPGSKGLT